VVLGIVVYFYLRSSNPAALDRVGEVYGDAPAPEDVPTY
jgi:hypothetical protein